MEMRLTPYNQNIINISRKQAKIVDPIGFCGMYNDGHDFLYARMVEQISANKSGFVPVFLDLSACSTEIQVLDTLRISTSEYLGNSLPETTNFDDLNRIYQNVCSEKTVIIFIYTGQASIVDKKFLLFLSRMRDLKRSSFAFIWLACTRILFSVYDGKNEPGYDELLKKLFINHIYPLVPRDKENSKIIIDNNEARYGQKLPDSVKDEIFTLSGGHPGLLKTLGQQASETTEWKTVNLNDERLSSKVSGILNDLPDSYKNKLFTKNPDPADKEIKTLIKYGYLKKEKGRYVPFTPLLGQYYEAAKLDGDVDSSYLNNILVLTKIQRKVMDFFKDNTGTIVSKDKLAEVIWGDNWQDKYSEWAIDQFISTFRDKLALINQSAKLITKKGEGYIFIP